jgi:lysophospholipase L1-like esterase
MKVVLIGDSIRRGYQALVQQKFANAEVWGPVENCEHGVRVLDYFKPWVADQRPDIVHANFGLHDVSIQLDGEHKIILAQYQISVQRFIDRVKAVGIKHLIWATTTPLYRTEPNLPMQKWRMLSEAHIDAYNAAALEIVQRQGIAVNDLHAVIMRHDFAKCLSEDGCHMSPFGNEVLSDAVVAALQTM